MNKYIKTYENFKYNDISFNNTQLHFDFEKIQRYNIDDVRYISKDYDEEMEPYPYIIDILDDSYYYTDEDERDEDYKILEIYIRGDLEKALKMGLDLYLDNYELGLL